MKKCSATQILIWEILPCAKLERCQNGFISRQHTAFTTATDKEPLMSIFDFFGSFFSVTQLLVAVIILILLFAYVSIRNLFGSNQPHKQENYENSESAIDDKHNNLSRAQTDFVNIHAISATIVMEEIATSDDLNPLHDNWDYDLSNNLIAGSMGNDRIIGSSLNELDDGMLIATDNDALSSFDDTFSSFDNDDMLSSFDD